MLLTYQFKLNPTPEQVVILETWGELLRRHWNYALGQRLDWLRRTRLQIDRCSLVSEPIGEIPEKPDYYTQASLLKQTKELFPDYKSIYADCQQQNLIRLDKAWKRWLIPDKKEKRGGRPRFKKRGDISSFTFPRVNSPKAGAHLVGNILKLSKIGEIEVILHRPIPLRGDARGLATATLTAVPHGGNPQDRTASPDGFEIKQATILVKADGWYVSFSLEDKTVPEPLSIDKIKSATGIDVGLEKFLTTADGQSIEVPQYYRKAQTTLARQQRKLARSTNGSKNYQKQANKVARLHLHVARQRKEFHNHVAYWLVNSYDLIIFENLNIRGLARTRLAKSILDVAWRAFLQIMQAVAVKRGKLTLGVDPRGTSINCSSCGERVEKTLAIRIHSCSCGLVIDRDWNSALNLLKRGSVGLPISGCGGLGNTQPVKQQVSFVNLRCSGYTACSVAARVVTKPLRSFALKKIENMTTPPTFTTAQIDTVRSHIKKTWKTLTRSHEHLLQSAKDTKLDHKTETPWLVYISPQEDCPNVQTILERSLSPKDMQRIEIRTLPSEVEAIKEHGLLYLPGSYVVPGGRFNEMYGWDSYFILLGLLRDEEWELAQSQVDQLLYQVQHYGTILNSNRTYMLSRSQPPVLSMMVLALFQHTQDEEWLKSALPLLEQFYYYWVVPPHLNAATGLSRFYALGEGAAPEVLFSERDEEGKSHYDRVKEYYQTFEVEDYDVNLYYDRENDELTNLFYKGDRTMRESGFDITNRFGPFSADILHYAPVCLNSLLYQMEQDLAQINQILGKEELEEQWRDRADIRRDRIDQYLWDEEQGIYLDYNFQSGERRRYEFATTFYPLWLGIASVAQAQRVAENLSLFEAPGGIFTSTRVTGNQWDAPFGWAPLTLIAVLGLHRYGYHLEGDRIANKFLAMVIKEFGRHNTLVEKYDVERCSANVSDEISFGYSSNEVGFGWTNGVILELLAARGKKV